MASNPQAAPSDVSVDPAAKYLGEALHTSFRILKIIMAIVLVLFLCSGTFQVEQSEVGLVLRFGRFVGPKADPTLEPGFHWAWPYPIDEVVKVPVKRLRTLTVFAFWPKQREQARVRGEEEQVMSGLLEPGNDGYAITADKNLVHSVWSVRYRIDDPVAYLRNLATPNQQAMEENERKLSQFVSIWLQNTVIRVTGRYAVDEVLRGATRERFTSEVEAKLSEVVSDVDVGIRVEQVLLNRIVPPGSVIDAFNAVIKAEQKVDKVVQDARRYRGVLEQRAMGEAAERINDAEHYAKWITRKAKADAAYQLALLNECKGDRGKLELLLRRHQIEGAAEFLAGAMEKFVLREHRGEGERELRLLINRDPEAAKHWEAEKKAKEDEAARSEREPMADPEPEPPPDP